MYKTIASSLFLHKKCTLSGIGSLSMVSHSATTDFLSNRIQAPTDKIEFIPNSTNCFTRILNLKVESRFDVQVETLHWIRLQMLQLPVSEELLYGFGWMVIVTVSEKRILSPIDFI